MSNTKNNEMASHRDEKEAANHMEHNKDTRVCFSPQSITSKNQTPRLQNQTTPKLLDENSNNEPSELSSEESKPVPQQPRNRSAQGTDALPKFNVPDGGYGWIVALSACLANAWIVGFIKSYSVLYVQVLDAYPSTTAYHASWIPALLSTTGPLTSPLSGALCRKYTARKVSISGSLMCFIGLLMSAFATSPTQLIFTLGFLSGLGAGFVTTASVLIVSLYFDKRRGMGSAICVSGMALGGFVMPPIIEYLLSEYKLRGTLFIAAALQLQIIVSAFLFRPTEDHAIVQDKDKRYQEKKLKRDMQYKKTPSYPIFQFDLLEIKEKIKLGELSDGNRKSISHSKATLDEIEFSRKLSFYRNMPLTGSIPNLEPILPNAALRPPRKRRNTEVTVTESSRARFNDSAEPIRQMRSSNGRAKRNRSVSESTAYNTHSSQDPGQELEITLNNRQLNATTRPSLRKQTSLLRYAVTKTASQVEQLAHSNASLTPSEQSIPEEEIAAVPALEDEVINTNQAAKVSQPRSHSCSSSEDEVLAMNYDTEDDSDDEDEPEKEGLFRSILRVVGSCFDRQVLKTSPMILMCLSCSMFEMGAPYALFYLHAHFKSANVDSTTVTKLLSLTSLVDLGGRLITGFVADTNIVPLTYLYFFCTGMAGACAFSIPFLQSVPTIGIVLGMYGFGMGAWVVLMPTMLARNHGIDKLPATYGFVKMLMGFTSLISPQISGLLVDSTGGFRSSYLFMGSCMMLASFLQKTSTSKPPHDEGNGIEQQPIKDGGHETETRGDRTQDAEK